MEQATELQAGTWFAGGRYQLEKTIGTGSFGEVWRASDAALAQPVALKILLGEWINHALVLERFEREIRAAARLQHPGIVQILDTGFCPDTGRPFYAMELVEGVTLDRLAPDLHAWLEIYDQLMAALAYAHARGIIHRDLKPDNILVFPSLRGWQCKILDFGIARLEGGGLKNVTGTGMVLGTPIYMSPEQAFGEASSAGPASDLYAAGIMLYELIADRPPFSGDYMALVEAHLFKPLPQLVPRVELKVPVPTELEQLIQALTQKRYADRPESAAVVREKLKPILAKIQGMQATQRIDAIGGLSAIGFGAVSAEVRVLTTSTHEDRGITNQARLQLMRLRDPVPPGRSQAKAAMWETALKVNVRQRPAMLTLGGPLGMGKARLARWLAEMGLEHGMLRVFKVVLPDRGDLPVAMHAALHRMLHYPRLERQALRFWVDHTCPLASEHADLLCDFLLTQLITETSDNREIRDTVESWQELWWTILRHRALNPAPLPLMLSIESPREDVDLTATLTWLHSILTRAERESVPLFVLLTIQRKTEDVPRELHVLSELHEVRHLHVGPLDREEQSAMARSIVPSLSEDAIDTLLAMSQGSPFFSRELLFSWLESGLLIESPRGLILNEAMTHSMPERLEDIVADKISDFLRKFGADANRVYQSLMVLAFLGSTFPLSTVQLAMDKTGVAVTALVRDTILDQRRLGPEPEYAFATALMQDVLISRARAMGLENMLRRHATDARIAGALEAIAEGSWAQAEQSLNLAQQLLEERKAPLFDEGYLHVLTALALIAFQRQEFGALERLITLISRRADEAEDDETADRFLGPCEMLMGLLATHRSDPVTARRHFRNARAHAALAGHPAARAWALFNLARNAQDRDAPAASRRYLEQTLAVIQEHGEAEPSPIMRRWFSLIGRMIQRLENARTHQRKG